MHSKKSAVLAAAAFVAFAMSDARDASACGGCFVSQSESTQVAGHRMVLSISQDATTLWDQISYSGEPESFAWVLPIQGTVQVGLSSDAMFEVLDAYTKVTVNSPSFACPNSCGNGAGGAFLGGGGGGGGTGGVTVLVNEVVGPYETVQLSAADPAALTTWLTSHGYAIPADVQPVIDQYVSEGSNFLALKLVPGQGINAMRPVRITSAGASPTLPLRMVAAGTGAVTPIVLWVLGEGRYEPVNFPSFSISHDDLVWNWDTQSSNYAELREEGFQITDGFGWLTESSVWMHKWEFEYALSYGDALDSYANPDGTNAMANLEADMAALHGALPEDFRANRLLAQLSRPALGNDLLLGASELQYIVPNDIYVKNTIGDAPACPPDPCGGGGYDSSGGGGSGTGNGGAGANGDQVSAGGGCNSSARVTDVVPAGLVLGLASVLTALRRRRRR